jgi:hypothetical protein
MPVCSGNSTGVWSHDERRLGAIRIFTLGTLLISGCSPLAEFGIQEGKCTGYSDR